MNVSIRFLGHYGLSLQLGVIFAALGLATLFPPAHGKLILVPVWPGAGQGMIAQAVDHGALLVGAGAFANSAVVEGDRAALGPAMLSRGVLVLAAPPAGCGGTRTTA